MGIFDWGWNAQSVVDKAANPVAPMPQNIVGGVAIPPYNYSQFPALNYAGMPDPYGKPPSFTPTTNLNLNAFPDPYKGVVGQSTPTPSPAVPNIAVAPSTPSVPSVSNGFSTTGIPTVAGSDNLSNVLQGIFSGQPTSAGAQTGAQAAGTSGNWLTNTFMNKEGGLDMGNLGTLFDGLKSVFGIWGGLQQLGMAKDAFNFEKEAYIENRDNQKKSYNSTLEDRQRARAAFAGESDAETQRYVDKHKLR